MDELERIKSKPRVSDIPRMVEALEKVLRIHTPDQGVRTGSPFCPVCLTGPVCGTVYAIYALDPELVEIVM